MWIVSASFFTFILSHLLADILFPYRETIYHFSFFLTASGLGGIVYYELEANKLHISSKRVLLENQGRLLNFELLFIMIILFVMNH